MNKIFTLVIMAFISLTASAQQSTMRFAGSSTFGVASMNAWQDNETDTIAFSMKSTSEADITLPTMTYNAMKVTIPGFTIHGLKFEYNAENGNASFADQTYTETINVDGEEKTINGTSFSAEYNHAEKSFTISTTMTYGKMPLPVTFKINAVYVSPTSISNPTKDMNHSSSIYDISGKKVNKTIAGNIYIKDRKKFIAQ